MQATKHGPKGKGTARPTAHGPASLGDTYHTRSLQIVGRNPLWIKPRPTKDPSGTESPPARGASSMALVDKLIHPGGGVLPWRTSFPSSASCRAFLNLPRLFRGAQFLRRRTEIPRGSHKYPRGRRRRRPPAVVVVSRHHPPPSSRFQELSSRQVRDSSLPRSRLAQFVPEISMKFFGSLQPRYAAL